MSEKLEITGITLIGNQAAKIRYKRTTSIKSGYSDYEYNSHTSGHITSGQFIEHINVEAIKDIVNERLVDDFIHVDDEDDTEEDGE